MNLRSFSLSTIAASALLVVTSVQAHDPRLHESTPSPKAKPTTCAQLADTQHYAVDLTDPDTKALKTRCDAEAKAAASGKKAATPSSGKN